MDATSMPHPTSISIHVKKGASHAQHAYIPVPVPDGKDQPQHCWLGAHSGDAAGAGDSMLDFHIYFWRREYVHEGLYLPVG